LYQFWVHTEQVPKLGWFDRWFCSPSNHRVHHAVNDPYLDKNYGGILIVWDRLFGSFQIESEKCVYGTRSGLNSWDPLWANFEIYWALLKDSWHTRLWGDKVRVWFKPPGWRPADLAQRFPKPEFELARVARFHPPISRAVAWFAGLQFALLLAGVSMFLWFSDSLPLAQSAVWLAALTAALWALGAVLQGRIGMLEVLLIEAAALATATGTVGLLELHHLFKPLAMLFAILFVASSVHPIRAGGRLNVLLMAALTASLAGDVLLMLPGHFVPGLVAFLLAHLCYLVLFKLGTVHLQPVGAGTGREVMGLRSVWFPSRLALGLTLGVGAAMYAVLWHGLPGALRLPVAAYVAIIALMAAQAIGRATVLRNHAAAMVAVGAGFLMLSDALLAVNRFVQPLPLAPLWVLGTYYAAQILIARNAIASASNRL
ncbi:MAG: lysoplasmalogenase family protein, partial [Rhodoferax sp.]